MFRSDNTFKRCKGKVFSWRVFFLWNKKHLRSLDFVSHLHVVSLAYRLGIRIQVILLGSGTEGSGFGMFVLYLLFLSYVIFFLSEEFEPPPI